MKLLDTGIIYPIADSPWVSPIYCVLKKVGITVITDKNDELVPTKTITGWRANAFCLCNAPVTFQRCMLAIFYDMIEESVEVFMDDFSIFGNSFDTCLNNLDKMLQRCKDTHLVVNWEKCHFMVKQGIMLGHKVSSAGLEVDKAKIDVISKLPPLTNIKGIRSFLGHAGFYRHFIKDFSKIARPLTKLLEKETPFEFNDECQKALELLKERLTCALMIVSPNWNLPFELMCDAIDFAVGAEFDIEIKDRKGTKNVTADHLSRLENDETSNDSEVDDNFPRETLMEIITKNEPWFADFANYLVVKKTTTSVAETEISISKTSKDIIEKPKTVRPSAPIIEEWDTDNDNDSVFRPKSYQTKPKFTKINFVKSSENVKSVNKENTHRQVEYPRKSQSPRAATKSRQVPVNAAKQSSPRAAVSISTARPVNTDAPKPKVNDALPITYSYFQAYSSVKKPINKRTAVTDIDFNKKFNTAKVNNATIAGPKAVVSAIEGNRENVVESSAC
ncbi:reverse transcriptase domain-containing protein [Tanacetum coccineum]